MEELLRPRDEEPEEPKAPQRPVLPPRGAPPTAEVMPQPVESGLLEHSLAPGEAHEPPPGQALEFYDELDVLGSGGSGVVTLGVHRETGERVAIKRLRRASIDRVKRFEREAETIARLDHPGIVRLLQVVQGGPEDVALILELVEGPNLEGVLRADGRLPLAHALRIGLELASALAYAHAQGIVHRDVKPSNVLVGPDGRVKLADFGLALSSEAIHTMTPSEGGPLGTLDYMSPEQSSNAHAVDGRADVYSLGATLYRLLTGNSPRVIRERRIPEEVRDVVSRCVEEDPGERYASMQELIEVLEPALERALDASGVRSSLERATQELETELNRARDRSSSQRLLIAAAGLSSLGALPPQDSHELSRHVRLGANLDAMLAGLVDRVLKAGRAWRRPQLLADAHAILSAALGRQALGPEGSGALARLSEAAREPVLRDPVESLADGIRRLVLRRALSAADAKALARMPGSTSQLLDEVLQRLRANARAAQSPHEWTVHESIWSHALDDLHALLPHPQLAARIERERLALRMERLARQAEEAAGDA